MRASPFDADHRHQFRDFFCQTGLLGRIDDSANVLVGEGGFFGDAAHGRASDEYSLLRQVIDDLAASPSLQSFVAAHTPARAVTGGTKGALLVPRYTG